MNEIRFYTTGVYGLTKKAFFDRLLKNKIDAFIDIRRRRAVRGSQYSFANSNRLQAQLAAMKIPYMHELALAPTEEIRSLQKVADKRSGLQARQRDLLDRNFILQYKTQILAAYDFKKLTAVLEEMKSKRPVFFCVEQHASACHRSLVTQKIQKVSGSQVIHL